MSSTKVLIRNGTVFDGLSQHPRRADVLVVEGCVASIGHLRHGGIDALDIDATDKYVVPGLIDGHIHAEAVLVDRSCESSLLHQGVTTVVLGQDGCGFAPGSSATVRHMRRYFSAVNGDLPEERFEAGTVAEFLRLFDRNVAVNVAYLVPHGNLRMDQIGAADRAASRPELLGMRAMLEDALADGAIGMSSGLVYIPSAYASTDELVFLCAALEPIDGPFVTHMRGYGPLAPTALVEVLSIGSRSGRKVHISHLRGPAAALTPAIDAAAHDGNRVSFDSYPYTASATSLAAILLSPSSQEGGVDITRHRLASLDFRRALVESRPAGEWAGVCGRVMISGVRPGEHEWCTGMRLAEASLLADKHPVDLACDLLLDEESSVGAIMFPADGDGYADADTRALMVHRAHTGGSDGIYVGPRRHPRGSGTFARYLGRHVRELGDLGWVEAVAHLSTNPARIYGLGSRGTLCRGAPADIAVFDPATIEDTATYDEPTGIARGVSCVLVNGTPVLLDGEPTPATPGRVLRSR